VILHINAEMMQALAVLREVIGEDAGSFKRLYQLDLQLSAKCECVTQAEAGRGAAIMHVAEDIG
jgi:hypothetical protein